MALMEVEHGNSDSMSSLLVLHHQLLEIKHLDLNDILSKIILCQLENYSFNINIKMHEVTYLCARLSKRLRNTAMLDSPSGIELFFRNFLNHIGHALYPHVQNSSSILSLFLKYTTYTSFTHPLLFKHYDFLNFN